MLDSMVNGSTYQMLILREYFRWMTGNAISWMPWAPGHPTTGQGKHCGRVRFDNTVEQVNCTLLLPYICQDKPGENHISLIKFYYNYD